MAIFLGILKIIGTVLLWILLIVLFALLYILVFPFHYEALFHHFGEYGFAAKIKTFLHLLTVVVEKEDGDDIGFRIELLGGLIAPGKTETGETREAEATSEKVVAEEQPVRMETLRESDGGAADDDDSGDDAIGETDGADNADGADDVLSEDAAEKEDVEKTGETEDAAEPTSEEVEVDAGETKEEQAEDKEEKEEDKSEKIEKILGLVQDPDNQEAVKIVLKNLLWLLKHYLPKKFYADFTFSAGTPDGTGEILAVMAVLPIFIQNKGKVIPDFMSENPYITGEGSIKGNVSLGLIIVTLVRIIAHKETIHLIKSALSILGGKKK